MGATKFVLRPGKKVRDKQQTIYIQYINKGERFLCATEFKCEPRHWDAKKGLPKKLDNLEKQLSKLKFEFLDKAIAAVEGEPDAYKVGEAWKKYKEEIKSNVPEAIFKHALLARWQDYIEWMGQTHVKGKARTLGTIRNNQNSRAQLEEFLKEKKRLSVRPEKFTLADYQIFDAYLTNRLSPNSVSKVKKHFKSFLKWHIKNGGPIGFNISFIEYSETAGIKISLTEKELLEIAQTDFKGHLNIHRDLMVLQASTGVRVSDLQRLCDNLNEDKTAFQIKVKKTGKYILVPILPLAKQVLVRHNYKVPFTSEQRYREGIKAVYKKLWEDKTIEVGEGDNLKAVPVHKEISSHDMVRTFINIAWKKGISIPTIATITGKSIQVITKNYLNEDKDFAAKEVLEKFDVSPLKIAK